MLLNLRYWPLKSKLRFFWDTLYSKKDNYSKMFPAVLVSVVWLDKKMNLGIAEHYSSLYLLKVQSRVTHHLKVYCNFFSLFLILNVLLFLAILFYLLVYCLVTCSFTSWSTCLTAWTKFSPRPHLSINNHI